MLFPRPVWTALLPALIAFGYSVELVLSALGIMYLFYLLGDITSVGVCYWLSDRETRARIRVGITLLPLLPLYRYGISICRLGGILEACGEPPTWRSQDPWTQVRAHADTLRLWVALYSRLLRR